jgi:O-antigen ligase
MTRVRRINFDWQIGLIGLSALAGMLITYNRQAATVQFIVIIAAIAAYLVLANIPDPIIRHGQPKSILTILIVGLPTVITAISLFTTNWSRWIDKMPALDPLLRVLTSALPGVTGPGLNPNVIGGSLAALLPLQVFGLRHARRWVSVPLIALTLIAILVSQTRGAWLSLLLVIGMWAMWIAIVKRVTTENQARRLWVAAVTVGGVAALGLLFLTPLGDQLLNLGGDRRAIWHNSVDLISDYPLSGLGLASFEMAYSTYTLLIHVGHTMHAHNLWLDMWLNQGIIGVIALAGMIFNAIWPKPSASWRVPGLLALGVMLLHGLIDDPYYGYGGVALPVVFIPLGLLIRSDSSASAGSALQHFKFQPAFAMWIAAIAIFLIEVFTPLGRAVVEANLGALAQTNAELSQYSWPEVPIQDVLRRSAGADLSTAEKHYQAALVYDPTNATANRRLGQIELAREQFQTACGHLKIAFQVATQQRATRQLLGECEAISGHPDEAARLWRTVDVDQDQINIRKWWYEEYLQDAGRAAQFQAAMNVFLRE